jgi:hypothetical protein
MRQTLRVIGLVARETLQALERGGEHADDGFALLCAVLGEVGLRGRALRVYVRGRGRGCRIRRVTSIRRGGVDLWSRRGR